MTEATHPPAHMGPDQHAGGPPSEPLAAHGEHHHDNSPEAVKKEIRKYLYVFYSLAFLTGVTVWISTFHFPTWLGVTLALVVALVKGSLVAAFFMHLISERRLIYAVLVLTVFFFGLMIWGPWHHRNNARDVWPGYDATNASQPAPPAGQHGSGH
ncbi:MAG TPA: cytochrome C oxidase subunit IV family protein [Thermoanaerobaculia bacterium]|nr:cytochrome C oxidase subunit IV family protein [Thermoanaerobaculia bacterium]